jgi:hypothetical protein
MSADSRLVLRSYIKLLHAGSQIARENFSRLSTTSLEQNVYPKDHSEDLSYFPLVYCRSFLGLKKNIVNISRPLLHDRLQTCNDFSSTASVLFRCFTWRTRCGVSSPLLHCPMSDSSGRDFSHRIVGNGHLCAYRTL